jgi:hypothetical protein
MRSADLLSPVRGLWTLVTAGRSDRQALRLLERLDDPSWVLRRVEEVCVIGRRLVQRSVWVVVQVERCDADEGDGDDATAFLPLNRFHKEPDAPERVFSVRDDQGAIVPVLVPAERDDRVVQALMAAVAEWVPKGDGVWRDQLASDLREAVAAAEPDDVRREVQKAQDRLRSHWNAKNADVIEQLSTVFETVAGLRLLLVPVPADGKPHSFSFDYTVEGDLQLATEAGPGGRFAARMGWRPESFTLAVPGAALSPLIQVVFRAPDGIAISKSKLTGHTEGPDGSMPVPPVRGTGDSTVHQVDYAAGHSALLVDAEATFHLRPQRVGLLRNGLIASAIISFMLVVGAVLMERVGLAARQADAAAALLLTAPSFFLLQAVQSYEHKVVSSILQGLRWTLLIVGLTAFFAALLLVATAPLSHVLWCLLATVAGLGTISLLIAYMFGSGEWSRSDVERPAMRKAALTALIVVPGAAGVVCGLLAELILAVELVPGMTAVSPIPELSSGGQACIGVGLIGLGTASAMLAYHAAEAWTTMLAGTSDRAQADSLGSLQRFRAAFDQLKGNRSGRRPSPS